MRTAQVLCGCLDPIPMTIQVGFESDEPGARWLSKNRECPECGVAYQLVTKLGWKKLGGHVQVSSLGSTWVFILNRWKLGKWSIQTAVGSRGTGHQSFTWVWDYKPPAGLAQFFKSEKAAKAWLNDKLNQQRSQNLQKIAATMAERAKA